MKFAALLIATPATKVPLEANIRRYSNGQRKEERMASGVDRCMNLEYDAYHN